ncbi:hypothetical protein [Thermococcus sp.]|nr:hypothetical protein [Thermococcus sp.]
MSMEQTKVVSKDLDNWGVAFGTLGKVILYFLWSTILTFIVTLPALGVLYLVGVPREFYVTAFVGYVVFNFSVTLKKLWEIKKAIEESGASVRVLFLVAFLVLNVIFVVYPVISWFVTRWVGLEIAVWMPFFLMWWEVSVISGKNEVLKYFTVTWLLVLVLKAVDKVLRVSAKAEMRTAMSPVAVIITILVAFIRK